MQKPNQNNKTYIIKDTIIFNQKDSIIIKSSDLKELNTQFKEIKHDINNHLNKEQETFLGASYDTVFTVIFTILIFTIGIIIDRWIKNNKEKKELKEIKTYFINQIQDIKLQILPFLSDRRFKSQMRKTMTLIYKKHLLDFQNSSFLLVFY